MNEQPNRYLALGQEVTYVGADKKPHKAKITELFQGTNAARVESADGNNTAVCGYSETGEINTFSFPSSATASAGKEKPQEAKQKEK